MTDPKPSPESAPDVAPESTPESAPDVVPEVTLESALEESIALDDVPHGGRVLVISSQPTSARRRCIALLVGMLSRRPPVDSSVDSTADSTTDSPADSTTDSPTGAVRLIDGGVVGEWHQGDDLGLTPDLAVLLIHHDCPHGHIPRLMEAVMAASGVAVLSVVVLPEPPDAA